MENIPIVFEKVNPFVTWASNNVMTICPRTSAQNTRNDSRTVAGTFLLWTAGMRVPKKLLSESLPTRTMCVTVLHYFTRAKCVRCLQRARRNHREPTRRRCNEDPAYSAHRVVPRWTVARSFFTRRRIGGPRGPGAPRRQGKVARAICPRPDCGSAELRRRGRKRSEREKEKDA